MPKDHFTELELVHDYQFRISFDEEGVPGIMSDEPPPVGGGEHPNATQLLSAAVGNCLCASLAFCLRKARAEPLSLKARVRTTLGRNERGRLRVMGMQVTIFPKMEDPDKLRRCLPLFEDFCPVTMAVRQGIDIEVSVQSEGGAQSI
jgi:uncharacterized OsmC-like protein